MDTPHAAGVRRSLPRFALYGETAAPGQVLLHIEAIQSRSSQHAWEIDVHVHPGLHQLVWWHSGPGEVVLDALRDASDGPVAAVVPPGVAHAFRFSPDTDGHVLTFSAAALAEGEAAEVGAALQTLFASPQLLRLEAGEAQRVQALFHSLLAESQAADAEPQAASPVPLWLARAVVWRLAAVARRHADAAARGEGAHTTQRALYTRWVVLLESHYREHWPVSRYASQLGLSVERLNRMVRSQTGQTAQALLHERLLRETCRRLLHVAVPVSALAFELGFDDPAYFCRFFKRHTGLSPRAWREQMRRTVLAG